MLPAARHRIAGADGDRSAAPPRRRPRRRSRPPQNRQDSASPDRGQARRTSPLQTPTPPQPSAEAQHIGHRQADEPVADPGDHHRHPGVLHPAQQPDRHRLAAVEQLEHRRHRHQRHPRRHHPRRRRIGGVEEQRRPARSGIARNTATVTSANSDRHHHRHQRPVAQQPRVVPAHRLPGADRRRVRQAQMHQEGGRGQLHARCRARPASRPRPSPSSPPPHENSPTSASSCSQIGQPSAKIRRQHLGVGPPEPDPGARIPGTAAARRSAPAIRQISADPITSVEIAGAADAQFRHPPDGRRSAPSSARAWSTKPTTVSHQHHAGRPSADR